MCVYFLVEQCGESFDAVLPCFASKAIVRFSLSQNCKLKIIVLQIFFLFVSCVEENFARK